MPMVARQKIRSICICKELFSRMSSHWGAVLSEEVCGAHVGIRQDGGYFPLGSDGHSLERHKAQFIAACGDIVARAVAPVHS